MAPSLDHELGRQIADLLAQPSFNGRVDSRLIGQVHDLLGSDPSLLGPLRDMLLRPRFQHLTQEASTSARIAGRDALIQDLLQTYSPTVSKRLENVLYGILNLPVTAQRQHQAQHAYSPSNTSGHWQNNPSSVPPVNPGYSYAINTQAPAQGILTGAVIAVLSLAFGTGIAGLGWLLLSQSNNTKEIAPNQGNEARESPSAPAPPQPMPPGPERSPEGSSPWATPGDYKFGQRPNSQYPHTCAFSITDARGERTLADKSKLEFWACRDEGGNPTDGYAVTWGDGKRTIYRFNENGEGGVVGTNGQSVAIRWQNSNHNNTPIIVISHQDGATSWIPGNVGE